MIDNEGVICSEQLHCVACGSAGKEIHAHMRDQLFGAPGTWSTFRCINEDCRLAWLHPQPLASETIKLYQSYYTHATPSEAGLGPDRPIDLDEWTSQGLKASIKKLLGSLLPWWRFRLDTDLLYIGRGRPGRVLEVGCGSGSFLRVLQAAGGDATGLDFDPQAVAAARRAGLNAKVSDLLSENFPAGSFDRIVMDNVIEHLPDPPAVFAECYRVLRPGGRLILFTPNLDGYLHELYGADWRGLEVPRHLYLYSPPAMRRLAHAACFRRVELFSQPLSVEFMINQSKLIARRSGRTAPDAGPAEYARRAARLSWLRSPRGEYLVLVAQR